MEALQWEALASRASEWASAHQDALVRVAVLWVMNNVGVWFAVWLSNQMDHQAWLRSGKVQKKAQPLTNELWWLAFRDTLKNQLLVLPFLLSPMIYIYTPRQEFSLITVVSIPFIILVNDTGYYWTHRLFHQPWFYQRFHKKHHLFTAPQGVAAVYMTAVEYYINQVLPATVGMCITGLWFPAAAVYYMLSGFGGTMSHSGYWMAEFHDDHHRLFNYNFGVNGSFWDSYCGTLAPPAKDATPIQVTPPASLREMVYSNWSIPGWILRHLVPFAPKPADAKRKT